MSYHQRAYEKEVENWARQIADPQRQCVHESWFRDNTADFWRHERMYGAVDCFVGKSDSTWLTIGDGRYGLDSIRLRRKGINAVPTDISEHCLSKAKRDGLIDRYYVENAESLTFGDESFDYVFCKETFHHLPRPIIALYEMLRVAREGVVLIEPNDYELPFLGRLANLIMFCSISLPRSAVSRAIQSLRRSWANKKNVDPNRGGSQKQDILSGGPYEPGGNFIYTLSKNEVRKVALGLNLPAIAYKGLNDCYIKGCEFELASFKSSIYRKMRLSIFRADLLSKLHLGGYNITMMIIFKKPVDNDTLEKLRRSKWNILQLTRNPYL